MKKIDKKHRFRSMAVLMMTVFSLVSCLSDDTIETTPQCAITGFTINSITCDVKVKKYDQYGHATDTIVQKTLYGTQVHFNIDQLNGHIYTTDSLPNWVDLTAVVPNTLSQGDVYYKLQEEEDERYFPLVSGTTTIDFSKTVELLCASTDALSKRIYKVDIYKRTSNADTLEWKSLATNLTIVGESKAFHVGGKVYVFAQNEAAVPVVTSADSKNAGNWSTPITVPVDNNSVVWFNGHFYGLGSDGYIYSATPEQLENDWTKASPKKVERLLAADAFNLYAYDGEAIIGSADLTTWTTQGTTDLDMLPETSINASAYTSTTNQNLQVVVMTGLSSQNSENGVVWHKSSAADMSINQPWAYIEVTPDNTYGMPHFGHTSMTSYKDALYAIGTESGTYKYLYRSDDNGITWHSQEGKYPIPDDLKSANGIASIVAVDKDLWIIQEDGKVWQGSIQ